MRRPTTADEAKENKVNNRAPHRRPRAWDSGPPRGLNDGRSHRRGRDDRGSRASLPGRSRHARGRGRASESRERRPRRLEDRARFARRSRGDSGRCSRPTGAYHGRGDVTSKGTRGWIRDDPARGCVHDRGAPRDARNAGGQRRVGPPPRADISRGGDRGRRGHALLPRPKSHGDRRAGLQRRVAEHPRSQRDATVRTQRARGGRAHVRVRRRGAPSFQITPARRHGGDAGSPRRRDVDAPGGRVRRQRPGPGSRGRVHGVEALDSSGGHRERTRDGSIASLRRRRRVRRRRRHATRGPDRETRGGGGSRGAVRGVGPAPGSNRGGRFGAQAARVGS